MLIHIFNDDSISILVDSRVVRIRKTHENHNEISKNLKLRNWDFVKKLIKINVN